MSSITRIGTMTLYLDWTNVESDHSQDQEVVAIDSMEKHKEKETKIKEVKKPKLNKVNKYKGQKEEIKQKRLQHKQFKLIEEIEGDIMWLYIFKNPNPELIRFVETYPSIQTLTNQLGWDLKITKDEAKKLLLEGFGPSKVFGRMQVSRRNHQKQLQSKVQKPRPHKLQKKFSYVQKSVFQKKNKPIYKQNEKLKYKQKGSLQIIPSLTNESSANEVKDQEQCTNQECKLMLCKSCFEKTLISKGSSLNIQIEPVDIQHTQSTQNPQYTSLQISNPISQDMFQESMIKKQLDQISIFQNGFHDQQQLLIQIHTPLHLDSQQTISNQKLFPEIEMMDGISNIYLKENEEQDQDIDLQLQNDIVPQTDKAKIKKRIRNKQPKEKKVSNNPFDRLR